jgi:hypothetical protein
MLEKSFKCLCFGVGGVILHIYNPYIQNGWLGKGGTIDTICLYVAVICIVIGILGFICSLIKG